MMRRARIGVLFASAALFACADSREMEDREPVTELAPGGAVSDAAEELRFEQDPRRLVYSPAVDLTLTAADTANADTAQADTAAQDTAAQDTAAQDTAARDTAARDTASPAPERDTTRTEPDTIPR